MNPAVPDSAPRLAGRYALLTRLGEGGMARVYGAWDTKTQVPCAIKVLLPKFAESKSLRRRFQREATALLTLAHTHVVRVHAVDTEGALPFLVMDLAVGGTLEDWGKHNGPLSPRQATNAIIEICRGLRCIHKAGIIHRDVKPHNVLVDANGRCCIADLGVARAAGGTTKVGVAIGTLGYMPPEQAEDSTKVDERSDVYGLGATLYVALTRDPPEELLFGGIRLDRIPLLLGPVLARCLHRDRDGRFRSVAEVEAVLTTVLGSLPPDPPGAIPLRPQRRDPGLPGEPCGSCPELFAAGVAFDSGVTEEGVAEPAKPLWTRVRDALLGAGLVGFGLSVLGMVLVAFGGAVVVAMGQATVDTAETNAFSAERNVEQRLRDRDQLVRDFTRVVGVAPEVTAADPAFGPRFIAQLQDDLPLSDGDRPSLSQQRLERLLSAVEDREHAMADWTAAAGHPLGQAAIWLGLSRAP